MKNIYHSEYYMSLADTKRWRFIKDVEQLILYAEQKMYDDNQKKFIVLRNKAIGALLYITAGRVSEVSDLYIKDLKIYENRLHQKYMSIDIPNRKNKKQRSKRNISNFKNEKYFIDTIYAWYRYLVKSINPNINAKKLIYGKLELTPEVIKVLETPLLIGANKNHKKINENTIRKLCYKYYNLNSHTFRKIRLTHLVIHYNMSAKEVQSFAGHSSIVSSEPYVNITNRDYEAKMSFTAR